MNPCLYPSSLPPAAPAPSPQHNHARYDAENHLVSTAGVTYTYDGDGKRIMKSNGTIYWYGMNSDPLMETNLTNNFLFNYFFFNGRRVARQDSANGIQWYFNDHLGTARVFWSTAATTQSDFYPFGGERVITSGGVANNYRFTGKERDSESNLDNFGARYDASAFGRFMSPDPESAGANDDDPQSWNAYTYVDNNPIMRIDPDGRAEDPCLSDPDHCAHVEADGPRGVPLSYSWRVIWQSVGNAANKANEALHTAAKIIANSKTVCVAGYTAAGALSGASVGAETGFATGTAIGLAGFAGGPTGFVTTAGGAGLGTTIGGVAGGFGGGTAGYYLGQAICSTGTGSGGGSGGGGSSGAGRSWKYGSNKSAQKWANQMRQRGWTEAQIDEAINQGQSFPATNNINPANGATRFVSPSTGRSVVIDNVTKEIIHVGGTGFRY